MKKIPFIIMAQIISLMAVAQQSEFSVSLNSGLFSFEGAGVESTTNINEARYTNNPYGSHPALSYGISTDYKYVTAGRFIAGVGLGYEKLRSRVDIDKVFLNTMPLEATGRTFLSHEFLNLNPFIGYRLPIRQVVVDLTVGIDVGILLNAYERGRATASNGQVFTASSDRAHMMNTDLRPRIQLEAHYKQYGIYVGHSTGLSNYQEGMVGGVEHGAWSKMLRFGVSYRFHVMERKSIAEMTDNK